MQDIYKVATTLYAIAMIISFFYFFNPEDCTSVGSMLFLIAWFAMCPFFKEYTDSTKKDFLIVSLITVILAITIILYILLGIYNAAATATVMIFFTIICIFVSLYFRQLETTDKLEKIKEELQEDLELEQGHSKYLRGELREKEELTNKNKELKENISILRTRICELTDRNEELHDEIDELNKDIKEHNRDWIKVKRLSSEIEKLKEKQNEHLNKISELEKENKELRHERVELFEIIDSIDKDRSFLLEKLDFTYKDGFECLDDDIL